MALKIAFGAAAGLMALLGYVGFRRDLRRGVMALAGTLLGATLIGFWADSWGQFLVARLGGDPQRMVFVASSLGFLLTVLIVGYGGGLLLGPKERAPFPRRLAAALLGVLNGALVAAYLLRFGALADGGFREEVQAWQPARLLHDGLPLLFLVVAGVAAVLVLVRGLIVFANRDRLPPPRPSAGPQTPVATSASAPNRVGAVDVLDKVNDALHK
jgi:Colicin V production protein